MACQYRQRETANRFELRRYLPISAPSNGRQRLLAGGPATQISIARTRNDPMRKALPSTMFSDPERSRLSMLRTWVLDNQVTEIEMRELQFWNFAQLQPVAEKPWATFMGRMISVPDMPVEAQKYLGIFDKRSPGAI
jgi:hypothetical protein